jgi:serine/threonine protein kinase
VIGTQIGGYRVVEHLASGGMGAVYVARHEILGREAVIKVLLPAFSTDEEMVRRFVNEARATAQIRHPGIVEVFDIGSLPSGQTYITMERLDGESLADRLRRGPLTSAQILALTRQLGRALGAAHDIRIVHRDLKPQNLFLMTDPSVRDPIVPSGERLKILDFGIAKLGSGHHTYATATGALLGTPMYMAPEQWTAAGDVDARADLYAVGCILFECLCGRPPFVGGIELVAAHVRDLPPSPRSLNPAITADLERVLLALLEKDPSRRPQSCAELVTTLEQAVQPELRVAAVRSVPLPADTVKVSEVSSVAVPPRSRLWLLAAAATAALLLVASVVGYAVTRSSSASSKSGRADGRNEAPSIRASAPPTIPRPIPQAAARMCVENQFQTFGRWDAFVAHFAEDAFVFLPHTVVRGRADLGRSVRIMYRHAQPTGATLRGLSAFALADDVVWAEAELEVWSNDKRVGRSLRVTELVVLDEKQDCVVVAAHISVPVGNKVARDQATFAPPLPELPGAQRDPARAAALGSPSKIAEMLADDPNVLVIGSAPGEMASGPQARQLLEKWSRNWFEVDGDVLHVESPRGYAFDAANVWMEFKDGNASITYRLLVLYRLNAGKAEVVLVHYSNAHLRSLD